MNISSLVKTGYGTNIIQGSISLDNKTEDNYTIILPNIYYYLKSWWADLKAQGLIKGNRFVHKITD